jgi:hypothetical protein
MSLTCRRCSSDIGEEEVAHLVAVRTSGYTLTSEFQQSIIICGDCLDVHEKGFNEHGYVYVPKPKPQPTLTEKEARLLEQVALGRVYRLPRRVMFHDPLTNVDKRCTDHAYKLLKLGFVEWEVVPEAQKVPGGPNAWMRTTEDGREFLLHGNLVNA